MTYLLLCSASAIKPHAVSGCIVIITPPLPSEIKPRSTLAGAMHLTSNERALLLFAIMRLDVPFSQEEEQLMLSVVAAVGSLL